jgi:hypothetical protein
VEAQCDGSSLFWQMGGFAEIEIKE